MKAFLAGFLSVLVFHQGMLSLLFAAGSTDRAPYPMTPTWPVGVPAVVSSAFWGGLWAVALWRLIVRGRGSARYWTTAIILGALLPSAVALFIVFPLKGLGFAGGWDPKILVGALLLNGAWGLGVAVFMRLFARSA